MKLLEITDANETISISENYLKQHLVAIQATELFIHIFLDEPFGCSEEKCITIRHEDCEATYKTYKFILEYIQNITTILHRNS